MDADETKMLLEAMGEISEIADRDCLYYGDDRCTLERPRCESCCARAAYDRMERLLSPCPRPLQEKRLRNVAERIFWEEWQRYNKRQRGLNHGFTALEHILNPHIDNGKPGRWVFGTSEPPPPPVTTRDAQVAAAVIQWLGTNGGLCFVQACERRILEEKAERAEWDDGHIFAYVDEPESSEAKVAQHLADEFIPASQERLQQHFKGRLFKALRHLTRSNVAIGDGDCL